MSNVATALTEMQGLHDAHASEVMLQAVQPMTSSVKAGVEKLSTYYNQHQELMAQWVFLTRRSEGGAAY